MSHVFFQDAWLDSIDVNKSFAASSFAAPKKEDDVRDLSSDDFGKINRRIADILEPGETVRDFSPWLMFVSIIVYSI